jgi:DNA mismatch repair protein MutS2
LERGRAEVRIGQKRLLCESGELEVVEAPAAAPRRIPAAASREGRREPERQVEAELSLIGRRVEGALEMLDRYLDSALLGCLDEVRIVHGHGSGRLRRAVRRHLESHPAVAAQRPGGAREGGDGATVVTLRDG